MLKLISHRAICHRVVFLDSRRRPPSLKYSGTRLEFILLTSIHQLRQLPIILNIVIKLDSARISIQVDIGFGDSMLPVSVNIDYPTLLELPIPKLRAYTKETVIA
jgi:hypothetical protein